MVKKPTITDGHAAHGAAALTRRERQIMDILYRRGRATATEVMDDLSGTPNYSTVRTQLRVLEDKGHVGHEEHGLRYVYALAVQRVVSSSKKLVSSATSDEFSGSFAILSSNHALALAAAAFAAGRLPCSAK